MAQAELTSGHADPLAVSPAASWVGEEAEEDRVGGGVTSRARPAGKCPASRVQAAGVGPGPSGPS